MTTPENIRKHPKLHSPTYTQMPNLIFDYWQPILTPYEFSVLSFMCRKIFGFHKEIEGDKMSLSQIAKGTGQCRKGIQIHINKLIEYGLIIKIKTKTDVGDDESNLYMIVLEDKEGGRESDTIGVGNGIPQGRESDTIGVGNGIPTQKKDPTKETSTKENIQKKSGAKAPVASAEAERLKCFLFSKIKLINPGRKELSNKENENWIREIDLMIRIDNRKIEDIEKMIEWCANHYWWKSRLLSADKLRKNFDTVIVQMNPTKSNEEINREFTQKMISMYSLKIGHLKIYKSYVIDPRTQKDLFFANHNPEVFEDLFLKMTGGKKK